MSTEPSASSDLSPVKRALLEIRDLRARVAELQAQRSEPIAIVGMSVRAPGGVTDPAAFAELLWSGTDAISDIPAERWPIAAWYDEAQDAPGKMYTRVGGFVGNVDRFDAEFFGIAPVEAASMDPQQRLVLELAWEGLEDAGHAPSSLAGTRAGVYLGIANSDYGRALFAHPAIIDSYFSPGTAFSVAAGRVSYVLGLHGPAIAVDTACSSSLVALHLACQGLRHGDCDLALAGGVNLILTPELNVNFSKAGMMSREGRCRTFDAAADGYVRGEGGGMLVLRRLRDAVADGDRVLAVVRGSAVNQDGRSNGLTAPNGPAQEAVVRAALAAAGVTPAEVGYVEAHGTGTPLGDPIEVNALAAVMSEGRDPAVPLALGSVKTNIGHLEAAAGVMGVMKAVLALQRREIPPHLHLRTPNPFVEWSAMPFTIPSAPTPWPSTDGQRVAGVSAFGFSGTNAHVILGSAPAVAVDVAADGASLDRPEYVLALSARDAQALRELVARYRDLLQAWPGGSDATLAEICATANAGRAHFAHRVSVSGASTAALGDALDGWLRGESHPRVVAGVAAAAPRVAFLFPGQGPQYVGMGRQLYETAPAYRRAFDDCAAVLDPLLGRSIRSVVFPAEGDASLLDQTAYAQPAMFAIEYALAALWRSWGVEPVAVMGHSFGEYAAACIAGVVSLGDAARMVVARGRLVAQLPGDGRMAVVEASEDEVREVIAAVDGVLAIAAVNGPSNTVVSGEREAVDVVVAQIAARGRRVKTLRVSHAFHSPLMDPVLDDFERALADVRFSAPTVRVVSNLTGEVADLATLGRTAYWRDHLRHPVRFAQSIRALADQGITHFVEMSPHPVLLGMAAECVPGGTWLASLREDQGAWTEMLQSLQTLYADGAHVDWQGFEQGQRRRRVALPTYPFQRRRHWIDAVGTAAAANGAGSPVDLWASTTPVLDREAQRGPVDLDAASYPAKWVCLARLTDAQIAHTLRQLGAFGSAGEQHTLDSLLHVTGIVPAQRQLVARWLERLVHAGALEHDGRTFHATDRWPDGALPALWADAERRFVDNPELLAYVRNCAERLARIVVGRESALESLFPGGSFDMATALYERSATMRYVNGLASSALDALSRALPAGRVLRVLEVGAGTGGTTSALLRVLPADRTRYHFTDVSDAFLDTARARFAAFPQVEFARFDLDIDPAEQGYAPASFDVIVSANAVHAVKDLRTALGRLRALLAPGGVLVLVESTTHLDYFDITTGLIEGWQHFADDLRGDNPLLPPDVWTNALRTAGFADARAWPERGSIAEALGQHVIVACVPGRAAATAGAPSVTEARGASPATDGAAPRAAHDDISDSQASVRGRLAVALPSERVALMADVVRGEVMRILRLDRASPPARQARLMDLGMDSLMAVQLRNALGTLLGLDRTLPSTLIFDYPTIGAIAVYLLERVAPPEVVAPVSRLAGGVGGATSVGYPGDAAPLGARVIAGLSDEQIAVLLLDREEGT